MPEKILLQQYRSTRQHSCTLCAPLQTEDYIPQPREFASPPKWHLAHTTWFFEEMVLKVYLNDYQIYHEQFSYLFNSYYHTIGDRAIRTERGAITRPSVKEVYQYREYVDKNIEHLLSNSPNKEILTLVKLGINHEQQHQELLITDLKHTFSLNPIFPVYRSNFNLVKDKNEDSGWLKMEEGIYEIGHNDDSFCYDNEQGMHKVYLHNYQLSKALVTNEEYIEFIEAGGYENFNYWLDEGWNWVQENNIQRPLYWFNIEDKWHFYTLSGLKQIDPEAILAHISYYEAQAFATWKQCRLPTEFEWEAASEKLIYGKRWEWTNSAYLPYPGYKMAAGAVGEYNGKFMINQMVLRGGSVATPANHGRPTYRNFFHPQLQWQFTGIRLAK